LIEAGAPSIEADLRDPARVSKLKVRKFPEFCCFNYFFFFFFKFFFQRMYSLTPVKALSLSLSISNPISMMQSLLNLFLYRPGVRKITKRERGKKQNKEITINKTKKQMKLIIFFIRNIGCKKFDAKNV
jgi:hypothetical protein